MNNPKPESSSKPSDHHEESEHVQPINLATPRQPTPLPSTVTTFSGMTSPLTANQPVALRPNNEATKHSLMTLYFRTPSTRPPGPSHIMSPVVGQVSHAQNFQKQAIKNLKGVKVGYYQDKLGDKAGSEVNIKVIRMPSNDGALPQAISTLNPTSGMATGILPSALAGAASRHIVPTAMHPAISTGTSTGPMASIIKGTQVSHVIHQPYSSHVPRGPAAVASISAAPKSAVATPILRAPHATSTMSLASSMVASHAPVRARSPTLATGRTATPPVSTAIGSHAQVIDFQKNTVTHSLSCSPAQIGLTARTLDAQSTLRPGFPHSSIAITKPIVQHLQQVTEKSYLKAVSGIGTAAVTTVGQHGTGIMSISHSSGTEVHNVCVVPTITRATISNISAPAAYAAAGIVQLQPGTTLPQHVPSLRPSLIQPQALHALTSSGSLTSGQATPHQTFTVISAKSLPQSNQSVTLTRPAMTNAAAVSSTAVVTCSSSLTTARPLCTPNTINCQTIPVAKVYPQPLPSQVCIESSTGENVRNAAFVSQASSTLSGATSLSTTTTTAPSHPQAIVISDKRPESSTAVRFTSLTKPPIGAGGASFVPPAYVYEQYGGALAVHPYTVASSNQGFAATLSGTQLRPLALSQHGSANIGSASHSSVCIPASSLTAVQPINSLMVAVDSRHVALHPQYSSMTVGKGSTEVISHATTTLTTSLTLSTTLATTTTTANSHSNSAQQQQNVNNSNHVSPRPSILRKRTSEIVSSMAKRNLIPSLCTTEPSSTHAEVLPPSVNVTSSAPSTKLSESQKENGLVPESEHTSINVKKEPGLIERVPCPSNDDSAKDIPLVEVSPRKKPRKQLLAANDHIENPASDGDKTFEEDVKPSMKEIKIDDSAKWVTFRKRPAMTLLGNYRHGWKARNNHFIRYSDVRPKEEKKTTANELANQKNVLQEANGWKVMHLTTQMEDLCDYEESVFTRLSHWVDLEEKGPSPSFSNSEDMKILTKLTDLVKGNLQRSKIAQEQATESRQQIIRIIDHKPNILDILNKNMNRRPLKKKDKS